VDGFLIFSPRHLLSPQRRHLLLSKVKQSELPIYWSPRCSSYFPVLILYLLLLFLTFPFLRPPKRKTRTHGPTTTFPPPRKSHYSFFHSFILLSRPRPRNASANPVSHAVSEMPSVFREQTGRTRKPSQRFVDRGGGGEGDEQKRGLLRLTRRENNRWSCEI